jgi:hypothetical protein
MAVGIFDLEFVGPVEVLRRASDSHSLGQEPREGSVGVLDADPEPGTQLACPRSHNMINLPSRDTEIIAPASQSNEKPSVSM